MPKVNKAETAEEKKENVKRATDLFPVEIGFVDRGANKVPILVYKNQEAPVTTSALKGATLAALMVTAYDSLDADAQAAAKAKILEGLSLTDTDFDALLGGTMAPPEGAASVVAEALGLAEDDVAAAIAGDASSSEGDDTGSTEDTDMADGSGGTGDAATPPPATPAPVEPPPAEGSAEPTQMADDPTYVFDSGQKKRCLMTIDEQITRLTEIRAKVQALPESADGFWNLPLSIAPDVAGVSHLAYALDSFQDWNFCLLYKAENAQPVGAKKGKDGKSVEAVHKNDKGQPVNPQPAQSIDLKQALTQAVLHGTGPMAAIVRKSIKDELAVHLAEFRAGLQQDAGTKQGVPQIAPSVSISSEQGSASVETALKNAQDVQARAKQIQEERLKNKKSR